MDEMAEAVMRQMGRRADSMRVDRRDWTTEQCERCQNHIVPGLNVCVEHAEYLLRVNRQRVLAQHEAAAAPPARPAHERGVT